METDVHVGQITRPTIIEGSTISRDTDRIHGQIGPVGPNTRAHYMTFQKLRNQSALDLPRLVEELARLRAAMKQETKEKTEQGKNRAR